MMTLVLPLMFGVAIGWWLKAVYYKRNRSIRTKYEWYSDPVVLRNERLPAYLAEDPAQYGVEDDDANIPWWMP
jgi:hypothetical protein